MTTPDPQKMNRWLPIATAPRDSTRVLVFCPTDDPPRRVIFEAWWAIPYEAAPLERGWWCYDGNKTMLSADVHRRGATYWMPLPDPPLSDVSEPLQEIEKAVSRSDQSGNSERLTHAATTEVDRG
jgi:hypothetical protein